MVSDEHLTELKEAARQAGYIVTEQIDSIIHKAERQAETIRREAERDAEDTRREAVDVAKRLLDRLHALEFPLGESVVSLRDEVEQVSRELGRGELASTREGEPVPEEGSSTDADVPTEEAPQQPTEPEPEPATPDASEPKPVIAAGQESRAPGEDGGKAGRRSRPRQR